MIESTHLVAWPKANYDSAVGPPFGLRFGPPVSLENSHALAHVWSSWNLEDFAAFPTFPRFSRSDLLHLLPLPPAENLLRCLGRGDILTQAGHEFGGEKIRCTGDIEPDVSVSSI